MLEAMSDDEAQRPRGANRDRTMATSPEAGASPTALDPSLSLFQLLDPAVLADPYPFYRRLREQAPVHWDPFLHTWVVTRYEDVMTVLHSFSADRTPDPEEDGGARPALRSARSPT